MRLHMLITVFIFSCSFCLGQKDSSHQHGMFYTHSNGYGYEEASLGLTPEISFFGDYAPGMGIARGHFSRGCVGGGGSVLSLGYSYSPSGKFTMLHANAWVSAHSMLFGFYAGLRGTYLIKANRSQWAVSPQIGYGLLRMNIFYSYHFFFKNSEPPITTGRHSLTLGFYVPVYNGRSCGKICSRDYE